MTQDEAIAEVMTKRTVSLVVAGKALTIGHNKARRLAREGRFPVPIVPLGNHGYVVPTPALRRVLQLQDFTAGLSSPAEVPPAVKTTEGGPRLGPPSVSVPNNTPAKGEVRVNHSIRTGGA
jgi:hypothetical protein